MEHVEHGNLQRYIEIGAKFPDRQAPLITGQIASALQYMHVKGFVHRNLRPSVSCRYSSPSTKSMASTDRLKTPISRTSLSLLKGPHGASSLLISEFPPMLTIPGPPRTTSVRAATRL
ncbi:hypothetical protein SMACR_02184 [Sordaria macrospora]|uniref:Protein kinase domain-containing protein n=1 Tax=Sordaria macrospora TaxID=5147 RepID=A0A8S8ZUX5_SORMA|nr:hypothetical protein SMACR_02184 [Sordaria macrospora]WPJ63717.1 hypothetical protein SMAC4_02184 [Sordaria macrospora]